LIINSFALAGLMCYCLNVTGLHPVLIYYALSGLKTFSIYKLQNLVKPIQY
jgi:hypothetical protein